MSQQPVLAVQGEAVLEVEPEIARIEVSVAAVEQDRAKTLQLLNDRAVALADRLQSNFLSGVVPGGWMDRLDAEGRPAADVMPASSATSPYVATRPRGMARTTA